MSTVQLVICPKCRKPRPLDVACGCDPPHRPAPDDKPLTNKTQETIMKKSNFPREAFGVMCHSQEDWQAARKTWDALQRGGTKTPYATRKSSARRNSRILKEDPDKYADSILKFLDSKDAQ